MKFLATSPVFYFFVCIIILYALTYIPKYRKTLYILFFPFTVCAYLLLTGFGANLAVKVFAYKTDGEMCPNTTGILLPSGLTDLPDSETDYGVINNASFKRAHAAIEWLKKDGQRKLIISGDGAGSNYTEARLIYSYITEFDIDKTRLALEDKSTSTHLSAENVFKLLGTETLPSKNVTLITSELHMRRASSTFKKAGFSVCPFISDYQFQKTSGYLRFFPNSSATHKSQAVLHEIIGYLWYSWTERL
ncbi:MAG: YdcF family protein [Cellvibrionaceae bacterium]